MDSIAKQDQERALRAVAFWCVSQAQGIELEESVIKRLGFGSVEAMHRQLANWGLPDWIAGDAPKSSEPDKPERCGQTSEEPTELLSAHGAALLFYQALQKLNRAIGDLDNRKEYLQNGRFVAQEDTARGVWPEMGIEVGPLTVPLGSQQTPLEPLPALIAAYILADEPLEPLLEKLNKWSETVDKEQIPALIEGKKTSKGHVRGLRALQV